MSSLIATALVGGLVVAAPAAATPSPDVHTGDDWSITAVAGGYEITKTLDAPLPVVSDIPVLEVDGVPVGTAVESPDGTTLTVLTTEDLTDASSVDVGWASGSDKVEPTDAPVTDETDPVTARSTSTARLRALAADDDGSAPGTYSYVEDDYHFGDQAVALDAIGGIRGEMTGRLYLPTTGGARPVVVLLHGRHSYCTVPTGGGSVSNPDRWPCLGAQVPIPSYKGYETLAQTLATHGYAVVSISANSINANDNQLAADYGAQARGRLVLDTLEMLRKAGAGEAVSFEDAWTGSTVDLATALSVDTETYDLGTAPASGTNPGEAITPADLVGRFDLSNVGLMGHSRGGEGVVSAVNLNQAADEPFGITSVLPLAPVDFGRETAVDTDMLVILPYCDGDVSNQQGQHFSDDSRYAFADDSLRSTLWVMGANHNFFNTVWTPGLYPLSVSDDWGATSTDAVCGPRAATNLRLTDAEQYQVGVATMAAWFRYSMGGEDAFASMFDGSEDPTLTTVPTAALWTTATAPSSARADIATFTEAPAAVTPIGSATATVCASAGARTLPQLLAPCATASTVRSTSGMPHWTPASFGPNVPASPMLKLTWTTVSGSTAGSVRVRVPAGARDASGYDALTLKVAPEENVATGTDLVLTVLDGSGATWSAPLSTINPAAVVRLPSSTSTTLNKIVLQQVDVPVATLAASIDVTDLREVRLAGATGLDATASGGVYVSDLALRSTARGTQLGLAATPTINVASTTVEEGSSSGEASLAVYLDKPATTPVSAWFTLIGSTAATSKAGLAVREVSFAPGQTCVAVQVPTEGDLVAGAATTVAYKASMTAPVGVVVGADQFGYLTVREDDLPSSPVAEVGVQGDPCAELAATGTVGDLTTDPEVPLTGAPVTVSAGGFRVGERVLLSDASGELGSVLADAEGVASVTLDVAEDAATGPWSLTATGGTGRTAAGEPTVLGPTTTSLTTSTPALGVALTLTATVTGAPEGTVVTFRDGSTVLGTAPVVSGVATFTVAGGLGTGSHELTAETPTTASTAGSTSGTAAFSLALERTTTGLTLSPVVPSIGTRLALTAAVTGAPAGTVVTFRDGSTVLGTAPVTGSSATLVLAQGLAAGSHSLTASTPATVSSASSASSAVAFELRKGTTATVLVLARSSATYGTTVTGTIAVGGARGGTTTVRVGSTTIPVTLTAGGTGTFTLPRALKVGTHTVSVSYGATDTTSESSTATPYTVKKAKPKVTVTTSKLRAGKKATVTVRVTGVSGVARPSGKVVVTVGGKKVGTVRVPANGKAVKVRFTVKKSGKQSVRATYRGDARYSSVAKSVKVTAARR